MLEIHNIAIDVGSGYTKAVHDNNHISFQSVANPFPVEDFFKSSEADKVVINGVAWIIGESAINSAPVESRQNTLSDEWAGSEGWTALLFSAIAQLGVKGRINLVTGIPQSQFSCKERRQSILTALKGKHSFEWKGREIKIEIEAAKIIPQAAGAILCRAAQDDSVLDENVGVIDIGTYTTGLTVMKQGELSQARSSGLNIGVSDLIKALASHLEKEYGYSIDKADGPKVLMDKKIKNRGSLIDITRDIDMLSRRIAKPMQDAVIDVWKGGNDLSIYIAGGGARYFVDPLKDVVPHAEIMENDFFAVVDGMLLYLESVTSDK